jgi:hypothetical protein
LPAQAQPKARTPPAAAVSKVTRASRLLPLAAAGLLAAWVALDRDKVKDINELTNMVFDVIDSPSYRDFIDDTPDVDPLSHRIRARDTTVRFAMLDDQLTGVGPHVVNYRTVRRGRTWLGNGRGPRI